MICIACRKEITADQKEQGSSDQFPICTQCIENHPKMVLNRTLDELEDKLRARVCETPRDKAFRDGSLKTIQGCIKLSVTTTPAVMRQKLGGWKQKAQGQQRQALTDGWAVQERYYQGASMACLTVLNVIH